MIAFGKKRSRFGRVAACVIAGCLCYLATFAMPDILTGQEIAQGFRATTSQVQPAMVKIVGSGGFQGLEPYQSGFFISGSGYILTVWSYVLDSDVVTVTTNDGQRLEAKLVGYDPRIEIAVLQVQAEGVTNFNLDEAVPGSIGSKVLAFSNLYGVATGNEPASVQQGIVSARTKLSARRGAFDSMFQGEVYILDAVTNNPGAAGGAITDRKGRLLGMIGKELRDSQTGSWLNFAIPIDQIRQSVNDIRSGKKIVQFDSSIRKPTEPMTTALVGLVLVPEVVSRTPPYIDRVISGSPADRAGLKIDDLVIEINGQMTPSRAEVDRWLEYIDRDSVLNLTVQRGKSFKSFQLRLAK